MAEEPIDQTGAQGQDATRRVRRRRSSKRSRRSGRPQASIPFTGLRFTRPRLPASSQLLGLTLATAALGLSGWAISAANLARTTLDQSQAQLAMDTRGAAVGQMAADRLAAQAKADTAQMMVQQDMARRQAAQASSGFGLAPVYPYGRSSQRDQTQSSGATTTSYRVTPNGPSPYGAPIYGSRPTESGPNSSGGSTMGYTLPQTTTPQ